MDNKDLTTPINKENQSSSLSDSIITNTSFVLEVIEIKEEDSLIIKDEETESETLNLLLSEPFTLEKNVNFVDKDFEDGSTDKPDENSKRMQIKDIIDKTINNKMSLNKHSQNVDQVKCLVDETSSEIEIDAEKSALLDFNTNQVENITECTLHLHKDNSNTNVVNSSIRNKQSLGTTNNVHSNDHTILASSRKKIKTEKSTLLEISPPNQDSSEISILGDNLNKNEKFKCIKSTENVKIMETEFKIKLCSVVLEKTIANTMNATDVCKVNHIDNNKESIVLKPKTQSSETTEFEGSRPQQNVSFSESVTGVNNSGIMSRKFKRLKSDIKSKHKHPTIESTSKSADQTMAKDVLGTTCEQNASSTTTSQNSAQESNHLNLNITSSGMEICSTKDLTDNKYLSVATQSPSGLKGNNTTDPKQTNTICKKKIESKTQKCISLPDNKETEIQDRLISQQSKEVSVIQITEHVKDIKSKFLSPSHGNETKRKDTVKSHQNPIEEMKQLIENLKGNKSLSLQLVTNNSSLTPRSNTSSSLTVSSPQNTINSTTPIQNNYTSLTAPTLIPSKVLPKQELSSKTEPKQLNLEELLDGAPPFIQEVFKCDNIRDGFINEDLIFVLSLLPDMEEMADSEKIKFQLRIIETITDVFSDPLLKL